LAFRELVLTDSNGDKIDNPRFLRQAERRLKKAQRQLSKKKKGSKKRLKQKSNPHSAD
jgi:putative transposase